MQTPSPPTSDALEETATSTAPWGLAAISGAIAAGVALAVTELLAGFSSSIPSLINAVADLVIRNNFEALDRFSRSTFGSTQKTALLTGIPATGLLVGAVTGVLARHRPVIGRLVFTAFAVVGIYAAQSDELANTTGGAFSAVVAAVAGALALAFLLRAAAHRGDVPDDGVGGAVDFLVERRRFVTASGGLAFTSVFAASIGSSLQNRRNVEGSRAQVAAELADSSASARPVVAGDTFDAVEGIAPLVTPNDDFYLIDTAVSKPLIDIDSWTLKIDGLVDEPYSLTFSELLAMDVVEAPVTLSCVSNEIGGRLVGNAVWRGVRLADILDRAGVDPAVATQVVGRSADGWTAGFPTELAFDGRTALVAFAMNGEPLPVSHGFPVRLVVAGLYGYVSATKWLTNIELTTWEDYDGFWVPLGWSKEGPIKTQSRIDVPRRNAEIPSGPTAVAGVAWAPNRSVDRVEVDIDGTGWVEARLSHELSGDSWRQWLYEWDANPGEHQITVRATDGNGETQTTEVTSPRPDGASGHHSINVRVS
jgi:DMSO/TMAO reductase YedYZ molybdopterin-dependent catalytic subunit